MWGVEVGITPGRVKRWHDRHRAHTLPRDPVSACLPPTPLHRCIGLRVRSLNDPHDARLRPFNRHTLARRRIKVRTDAPVTIRLLIPTPAQRVSLI